VSSVATYQIVYVCQDATTHTIEMQGAPRPSQLYTKIRGHTGYFPKTDKNKIFVMRYFPSRKVWRVFDLRKFTEQQFGHRTVVKAPRYEIEIPDLDAAIMFATLRLA
jgi:hypothetical protein